MQPLLPTVKKFKLYLAVCNNKLRLKGSSAKKGLDIYNKVNGGVEIQDDDDDDDDDIALIEAYLNNQQEQAMIEKFKFGKAWKKAKKIGGKALKYDKKGYNIYNKVNGGQPVPVEIQDDDIAQIQAYISSFWDVIGKKK